MRTLLVAALSLVLFTAAPARAQDDDPMATQGQFASFLVSALHWDWDGMTPADAIKLLTEHGVAPQGGWQADTPLTNGAMAQVFHIMYASFDTNYPSAQVPLSVAGAQVGYQEDVTGDFHRWRANLWRKENNRWNRYWEPW